MIKHDTHFTCNERLEEKGGEAGCCSCNGHHCKPNVNPEKSSVNKDHVSEVGKKAYKEIQELVETHYEELLDELFKTWDLDLHDISVRVETRGGLTISKSWRENQERIGRDE